MDSKYLFRALYVSKSGDIWAKAPDSKEDNEVNYRDVREHVTQGSSKDTSLLSITSMHGKAYGYALPKVGMRTSTGKIINQYKRKDIIMMTRESLKENGVNVIDSEEVLKVTGCSNQTSNISKATGELLVHNKIPAEAYKKVSWEISDLVEMIRDMRLDRGYSSSEKDELIEKLLDYNWENVCIMNKTMWDRLSSEERMVYAWYYVEKKSWYSLAKEIYKNNIEIDITPVDVKYSLAVWMRNVLRVIGGCEQLKKNYKNL